MYDFSVNTCTSAKRFNDEYFPNIKRNRLVVVDYSSNDQIGSCAVHHRFNLHSKYCRVFMILVHMLRMSYDNNFMSGRNYKIYNITTCHCCKIYDLRYIRSLIYSQHVALKDL